MRLRLAPKRRPPLALVLGGVLGAVLFAPLPGLVLVRILSPQIGFNYSVLLVFFLMALATLVLGYLLWRLILDPVTTLSQRAKDFSPDDKTALQPLKHYGTQELHALGSAVADMAGRLDNRETAIRTFTNHVTHELKTPLTAIKGAAELLEPGGGPENAKLISSIESAAKRMEELLNSLREVAASREHFPSGSCTLGQISIDLKPRFSEVKFTVEGTDIELPISQQGLEIALRQLVNNAVQHGANRIDLIASDGPELLIRDNGPGVSEGNRARIFEPFFTTRREEGGTGMGLNIVRNMLDTQHAEISFEPSSTGASFRIRF